MPQELQQWQSFCNRCQKPTFHQRLLNHPNHVLHLLLVLFCYGLWLPIWILITIVSVLERKPDFLMRTMRCDSPGLSYQAGALAIAQAKELPARTDRLLVAIIGKENGILLWFWRIMIVVAMVLLFGLLIFSLLKVALSILSG